MTADRRTAQIAPGRIPLIGHAWPLLRDRLAYVQRLRTYGPIVQLAIGPKKTITVINSFELLQEMLKHKSKHFNKGLLFDKLKIFGGDPLPVAEGTPHITRRRLMQPALHHTHVESYIETMRATVEPTISAWQGQEKLHVVNEMQLMAQGVVMTALFSSNPGREQAQTILNSVDTVFKAALTHAMVPISTLERLPTPGNRRARAANAVLRETITGIIADHRANPSAYNDLVSLLMSAQDETGENLSDEETMAEITALLAAGSETTAVTLAWLFHEIARNPEAERRLHEEVDTVLAGEQLAAEHIPKLKYTRMLIDETLRLHNPAWILTRRTTSSVQLGEFDLPEGTDVMWSPYAMHRDPDLYPNPLRFDPDRWLPERPQPPRGAFIPFGVGKRMCIGDQFSLMEGVVITALIASRWRLRTVPGQTVRPVPEITVHPSTLDLIVEPRNCAVGEYGMTV
ncbi:cytochrome P450 [Streptomyces sp. NPDC005525]|uniref:cytochrome P450 n=1 Tax=Streptomyces sp. NPDC005525 TaxID=3364720 RepID=UPI0036B2104C